MLSENLSVVKGCCCFITEATSSLGLSWGLWLFISGWNGAQGHALSWENRINTVIVSNQMAINAMPARALTMDRGWAGLQTPSLLPCVRLLSGLALLHPFPHSWHLWNHIARCPPLKPGPKVSPADKCNWNRFINRNDLWFIWSMASRYTGWYSRIPGWLLFSSCQGTFWSIAA